MQRRGANGRLGLERARLGRGVASSCEGRGFRAAATLLRPFRGHGVIGEGRVHVGEASTHGPAVCTPQTPQAARGPQGTEPWMQRGPRFQPPLGAELEHRLE